jgi:hypothetical protein
MARILAVDDSAAMRQVNTPESDGARALAAAVTQIEVALREARTPVEQLGVLIERMALDLVLPPPIGTACARETRSPNAHARAALSCFNPLEPAIGLQGRCYS